MRYYTLHELGYLSRRLMRLVPIFYYVARRVVWARRCAVFVRLPNTQLVNDAFHAQTVKKSNGYK